MKTRTVVLAGAALLLALVARAQDGGDLFAVGHGRALYLTHCAGCHGAQGYDVNGNPVNDRSKASTDGNSVPDLALIVVREGSFDAVHVANHVTGRANALNPDRTMPCWDKHFRDEWPAGDAMAAVKIYWLAKYLDSIQDNGVSVRR